MKQIGVTCVLIAVCLAQASAAPNSKQVFPPKIPGGKQVVTDTSVEFLKPRAALKPGTKIAKTPPTVDFMYYDCQTYAPKPGLWSAWGECLTVGDKCYSSIGDHSSPGGNAFLYEYDSKTKQLRKVLDARALIKAPDGHYTPGKFHSRIDLGSDGWLYFSTHRGSTRTTIPANHFKGGWIMRYHPKTGKGEIVAHAPLPMQCMPTSHLDPDRMIFYAGTADGDYKNRRVRFLAYDLRKRRVLYADDHGPYRYMILARSTGRVYFHGELFSRKVTGEGAQLVRFDPQKPGKPTPVAARLGLRAATLETSDGMVYTVDRDNLWSFNVKTEKAVRLGPTTVGSADYITSIDVDPKTNRYLYYIPGAHGSSDRDGSPLVQYDVKTRTRKVIAFLHPYFHAKYGFVPCGCFGSSVSPAGDKVYITWNGNRNTPKEALNKRVKFDICAFMVVHIPESERQP